MKRDKKRGDDTAERVLAAAISIVSRDGMRGLTTGSIEVETGLSRATIHKIASDYTFELGRLNTERAADEGDIVLQDGVDATIKDQLTGIRLHLVWLVLTALLDDPVDEEKPNSCRSIFEIATAPLLQRPELARLAVQVGAFSGGYKGSDSYLARYFRFCWKEVANSLERVEVRPCPLVKLGDPAGTAERIIASFFTAALLLALDPELNDSQLKQRLALI